MNKENHILVFLILLIILLFILNYVFKFSGINNKNFEYFEPKNDLSNYNNVEYFYTDMASINYNSNKEHFQTESTTTTNKPIIKVNLSEEIKEFLRKLSNSKTDDLNSSPSPNNNSKSIASLNLNTTTNNCYARDLI